MIEIENLTKAYATGKINAIESVSLTVKDGEIFGFIGPNGAGKSTTIKCMTGILPYIYGSIKIDGVELKESPVVAKRKIGFVPDDHACYDALTGAEYVNFIADIFGVTTAERKERMSRLSALFGMSEKVNAPISSYSHGMKQKISIIAALIHNPEVWILDEPLTGLDPESAFNLKELMREHAAKGKTVFFSSHILEVVEKLCTRVAIIDKGHIATTFAVADMEKMQGDANLEELFFRVTKGDKNVNI